MGHTSFFPRNFFRVKGFWLCCINFVVLDQKIIINFFGMRRFSLCGVIWVCIVEFD